MCNTRFCTGEVIRVFNLITRKKNIEHLRCLIKGRTNIHNYLNINDSFHLKDLEISKYKRESKARMAIKFCCLIFVNCGLFSFLNIKKVKI
jgi:hypothetical protein